jgi:hypothetical protein
VLEVSCDVVTNSGGVTEWYTDPFGRNGRTTPFPGSIKQFFAAIDNNYGVGVNGPVIGANRVYSGAGTRAPN